MTKEHLMFCLTATLGFAILGGLIAEVIFGSHGMLHPVHYELAQVLQPLANLHA